MEGFVVIGEGEKDAAPLLYTGGIIGTGDLKFDIAVDPIDGTTLMSKGLPGAIAVIAMAWAVIVYRRRNSDLPRQTTHNLGLEIIFTLVPFITASGLFYYTVGTAHFVQKKHPNPDVNTATFGFLWH
mgnify:CR=1 FL=1